MKTTTLHAHYAFFVNFFAAPAQLQCEKNDQIWEREWQGNKFYSLCLNSDTVSSLQLLPN